MNNIFLFYIIYTKIYGNNHTQVCGIRIIYLFNISREFSPTRYYLTINDLILTVKLQTVKR